MKYVSAQKHIKESQGGTCSSSSTRLRNNNGEQPISVDCSGTCSSCGADSRFCNDNIDGERSNAVPQQRRSSIAAPVGFCVLETFKSGGSDKQRLSFYDECSAGTLFCETTVNYPCPMFLSPNPLHQPHTYRYLHALILKLFLLTPYISQAFTMGASLAPCAKLWNVLRTNKSKAMVQ